MPFQSDEQRKAAFANMRGGGRSSPSKQRTPKAQKAPKVAPYGGDGEFKVGYAGNYRSGTPSYANWYKSLPNTTQKPATTQSGSSFGGYGAIPKGSFDLVWEDYQGYQPREFTTAEKILIGIPVATALWAAAPGIGAMAAGGVEEYSMGVFAGNATSFLTTAGTQGGVLGYSGLALSGIPMTVNDAPNYYREGNIVKNSYPDLVGAIGGAIRNQQYLKFSTSNAGINWSLENEP